MTFEFLIKIPSREGFPEIDVFLVFGHLIQRAIKNGDFEFGL